MLSLSLLLSLPISLSLSLREVGHLSLSHVGCCPDLKNARRHNSICQCQPQQHFSAVSFLAALLKNAKIGDEDMEKCLSGITRRTTVFGLVKVKESKDAAQGKGGQGKGDSGPRFGYAQSSCPNLLRVLGPSGMFCAHGGTEPG